MNKLKQSFLLLYPAVLLYLNIAALAFGVVYLLHPKESIIWNIYGFLMLATFLGNIGLAAMGNSYPVSGGIYLFLSAVSLSAVFVVNTLVSIDPDNLSSRSLISYGLIFLLFLYGIVLAYHKHIHGLGMKNGPEAKKADDPSLFLNILRNIGIIVLSGILYFGLYLAINLLRVNKVGVLEIFLSEYALYFAVIFLSTGVLIIKMMDRKKYYLYYSIVLTVTTFLFIVFLLPFSFLPAMQNNAEINFTEAFGTDYKVNPAYQNKVFRQLPFSMAEYFYGIPSKAYQLKKDVTFYEGRDGADQGLLLDFDVYMPLGEGKNLPGGNSVLIRIHGGAWTSGDKGDHNFAQMNKYFAAQGYVVFDIEYGLNDKLNWLKFDPVEPSRAGDFSIDDMVRHIGIFTKYLVEHGEEYHANLDSVFLSGGSAGGQLSLAAGLGLASGRYQKLLDPGINVKGLIPFYPANGISTVFDIGGQKEFVDPIALVDSNSPPCLIYQGSHDGLVDKEIAEEFRTAYLNQGNEQCAVLRMPFGGHASDLYFSGYYNQIFVYYMERFMYQYR